MRELKLSVVIVNWNTCAFLSSCLSSVIQSNASFDHEVIVVDNASDDGSAEMVATDFPGLTLLAEGKNHGYAKGNNLGFAAATGEYVLTLNSDTELGPEVLTRAIQLMDLHPNWGCLAVKLIGVDGKAQRSVRGFPTLLNLFTEITGLARILPRTSLASYRLPMFDYDLSQFAPQPMGTFLMFRRSSLELIGLQSAPFDEDFPIFFNEVDLLRKLADANQPCWYESSIMVKHYGGESTKQVRVPMVWESHLSLIRYLSKHVRGVSRGFLPLVNAAIWIGALIRTKGVHAGFRP